MIRVIWSDSALRQLAAITDYVRAFHPTAGAELARHLLQAGNSLTTFPNRGRIVPGTAMRELVTRAPYIIRYRVAGDTVRILRIRHTARRPTEP